MTSYRDEFSKGDQLRIKRNAEAGEEGIWDDDFTSKKFELGRVIHRDPAYDLTSGLNKLSMDQKEN
jgi:hypothetical protein